MTNFIFLKRLERLNRLTKRWAYSGTNTVSREKLAQQIIDQYLATRRSEQQNHLTWSDERTSEYNGKEFESIYCWVTVDPVTQLAKKGIEHLEKNELDKLRKILDELSNEQKLISKIKSRIRKSRNVREHPLNKLIASELQKNPTINLPNLTKRLKALEGKGVITQWDSEEANNENYIYSKYSDGKEAPRVKVSGLKERYYDVRNKK
jgi:hypothetical protein